MEIKESKPAPEENKTQPDAKASDGSDDSSSGISSSSDSEEGLNMKKKPVEKEAKAPNAGGETEERKELLAKLSRLRAILKQKQMSEKDHKKEVLKAAKTEQKR